MNLLLEETKGEGFMRKVIFLAFVLLFLFIGTVCAADKDTLVIGLSSDALALDPHDVNDMNSSIVYANIFDNLLLRTKDMKIAPSLATSYKMVNDTTWEFNLRKGVTFHNGEPFNAHTVKFTMDRVMDPRNKLKQPWYPDFFERIEVMDDFTVRFVTKNVIPYLDSFLCYNPAMIPARYFKERERSYIAANPVGSGPYKFVRWVKDDYILLEANEIYWRGAPRVKKLMFRPVPDPMSRIAALQTHEIDIIADVPFSLTRLIDQKRGISVSKAPGMRALFLGLDTGKGGPVTDKRVRRAIAHAIDVDSIIKNVLDGHGVKLASPIPPFFFGYNPEFKHHPYSPAEARRLLAEAGYPNGFDFPIHVWSMRKEVAEAAAGYLRKVGINSTARVHEYGLMMSKLFSRDVYPAYFMGFGDATFDAASVLYNVLRSGGQFSNFHNPKFDTLISEARFTMDKQKRLKALNEVYKLIQEEVPFAFSYQQIYLYGVNERVNWQGRPDEHIHVFDVSFKK
jgi:peptide/nickel transport system substrate-binding protein